MGVSWLLCLLTVLLATASVQGLTCQTCFINGDNCQAEAGKECTAEANGGCNTVAAENTLEGTTAFKGFSRGCMTNFASSLDGQLTFTAEPGRYVRISTKKCNADQCNKDPLTVPQVKDSPNGLQCPSCQAVGASTCIPVITPCKGEETFCVNLIGTFKKAAASPDTKFAALGCATPSADAITKNLPQQLGMFTFTEGIIKKAESIPTQPSPQSTPKPTTATTSGANPAPGQVPFALFLPGLTGLLLVKLLS